VLDNILIEIVAALVAGLIGLARYAWRRRRGLESSDDIVMPTGGTAQNVPPQLQAVIDQAMQASKDGKVDAAERAAIRDAALAAGAKGVAFTESTSWGGIDDLPVEHLGPPPPGPPPPPAPPSPAPPPA
jgi:hypothetical protein